MKRGHLRIYVGYAAGVGKTFAMLGEGHRRRDRGTDVVVGFVETHGRPLTQERIGDLEVVPRRRLTYRETTFEEMDVDAILARAPEVALVDELAHTNVPGSRNEKRWQDIDELLDAGIDVISTVNIQHLESVNDVVERITGVRQRETVPDEVVRRADQQELVDMTPYALRRRMAHGNIYPPEKIDAALSNYFREGNLGCAARARPALDGRSRRGIAQRLHEGPRDRRSVGDAWSGSSSASPASRRTRSLIRRAARMATRSGGELFGVHVIPEDGLAEPPALDEGRALVETLGGSFHEVVGRGIPDALLDFARAENITQIVVGASTQSRWRHLTRGSVINRIIKQAGQVDVHIISGEEAPAGGGLRIEPLGGSPALAEVGGRGRRRRGPPAPHVVPAVGEREPWACPASSCSTCRSSSRSRRSGASGRRSPRRSPRR